MRSYLFTAYGFYMIIQKSKAGIKPNQGEKYISAKKGEQLEQSATVPGTQS